MGLIGDLLRYRDERHQIIQLWHHLEHLQERFKERTAGVRARSDEFQLALADYGADLELTLADIAELETRQTLRPFVPSYSH